MTNMLFVTNVYAERLVGRHEQMSRNYFSKSRTYILSRTSDASELNEFQEMQKGSLDSMMAQMNPNPDFSIAPDIHCSLEINTQISRPTDTTLINRFLTKIFNQGLSDRALFSHCALEFDQ